MPSVDSEGFITDEDLLVQDNDLGFDDVDTVSSDEDDGTPSGNTLQGIKSVWRFRTPTGRLVDVVRSPVNSPLVPLHSFWSTLVCNFIAPDGCGCAYPAATIRRMGVVRNGYMSEKDIAAAHKYASRGFTLVQDDWMTLEDDPPCWEADCFGDVDAMVVSFRKAADSRPAQLPVDFTGGRWRIDPAAL